MATRRAAAGGEMIAGQFFKGGQFIPHALIAVEYGVDKKFDRQAIVRAEKKATFETLRHAAFAIRKTAAGSIDKSDQPSLEGQPPHTRGRGGHNLRGAIWVVVQRQFDSAVIGPREW